MGRMFVFPSLDRRWERSNIWVPVDSGMPGWGFSGLDLFVRPRVGIRCNFLDTAGFLCNMVCIDN